LIEEVARVFGYEHIPVKLPSLVLAPVAESEALRPSADLRRLMTARDYQEAITFTFAASEWLSHFGLAGHPIKNPLSADLDVMRPSILPNLLSAALQNQRRQIERVRLFELGVVFLENGTQEPGRLAFVATGDSSAEQWGSNARAVDFFDLKGDVEALLASTGQLQALRTQNSRVSFLHPGRSADLYLGAECIGFVGQLHPNVANRLDFKVAPFVCELSLDALQSRAMPHVVALSKFPSSRRDLALVMDQKLAFAAVEATVRAAAGKALIALNAFDVYLGAGVPAGHKSLAISLILQDLSRTLSDQEVDQIINDVVQSLSKDLGVALRA
jgi:phenylalanyl-tRNA synthetase beta chain